MKKYVNLVRLGVGLAAWGLALLVVFYPAGMAKRGWMAVTRVDMAERRRRNATHLAEAGASLRFLARLFIGLDIEAHVRTNIHGLERPASFILAGNHRHAMDATNYTVATKKIRQMSIRYVVKWAIVKIWFLGKLFRENGYAIVARKKDRPDLSSAERRELNRPVLEEYYRLAREDEVSVGIFPEGERFTGPKEGARRKHVGELVGKGTFREMCDALPSHGVAIVTVLWPTPPGGKTVYSMLELCDRKLDITVDLYQHPSDPDAFLEDVFDKMETDLANKLSRSPHSG